MKIIDNVLSRFGYQKESLLNPNRNLDKDKEAYQYENIPSEHWKLITGLRNIGIPRLMLEKENRLIENDAFISRTLNIYATEASNFVFEEPVTIASENTEIVDLLNNFLDKTGIFEKKDFYKYIKKLIRQGNLYFKFNFEQQKNGKKALDEDNPVSFLHYYEYVYHLKNMENGEQFFAIDKSYKMRDVKNNMFSVLDSTMSEFDLYDDVEIAHFSLDEDEQENIMCEITKPEREYDEIRILEPGDNYKVYNIVEGMGLLGQARITWRILRYLEDLLIMSRINKTYVLRLLKLQVNMADNVETVKSKIQRLKQQIRNTETVNTVDKEFDVGSIPKGPESTIIIGKKENGENDIEVDTIESTNPNLVHMADIDYFRNKHFAVLGIPKAYLSFEETLPGAMNNSALINLDARFSKQVNIYLMCILAGLTELCDKYLILIGKEQYIGEYSITINSLANFISDAVFDNIDRKLDTFEKVYQTIFSKVDFPSDKKKDFIVEAVTRFLPEIADFVLKYVDDKDTEVFENVGVTDKSANYVPNESIFKGEELIKPNEEIEEKEDINI